MSSEVNEFNGFANIALTTERPAWHSLGQYFAEGTLPSEAFELAKLNDIIVEKEDLYTLRNGVYNPIADQCNLVIPAWSGNDKSLDLGVVSRNYEIIQNRDLGFMLDHLGKYANVDVAGALFKGRVCFATFRGEKFSVLVNGKSDEHEMFLLIYEDKAPGHTIQFILSPVRTVCQNTYRAAEEAAMLNVRISHYAGATDMVKWGVDMLAGIASKATALQQAMQKMANTPIADHQVQEMVDFAWAMPEMPSKVKLGKMHGFDGLTAADLVNMPDAEIGHFKTYDESLQQWELAKSRTSKTRDFAIETYYGHPTQKEVVGTVLGAVNAITFTTDHYGFSKGTGIKAARSAVFGDRVPAKVKAWDRAMFLVGKN